MANPKKIINDPKQVVPELLDGLIYAYHGQIHKIDGLPALIKTDIPDNKVALLIGGGSGHEPVFHGFIGPNMADGAACGNIFAAPSPDVILAATQAVHRGKGVLYVYGNYAGDNMNFDIAAEMAEDDGIAIRTVRVWDDVASAPPERCDERRGIAGDALVLKVAGAATAKAATLDEAYRITAKARDNTRSMAVAVAAGSIPETGALTFELAEDEIEIGMGAHGEPGVSREKMKPADALVDDVMARILADQPLAAGSEVALLINDMGATTMMELLIVNRRVRQILEQQGIVVHSTDIGSFVTTQEMAGFSITLMALDEELKNCLDQPADSFGFMRTGLRG